MLFGAGSAQDPDNSEQVIADLDQGGLGLPDRDYYTKDDAKSKEIRERYVQHVQKIFELLGDSPEAAKKNADTVMRMETALAKASLTRVEQRNPYNLKNKMKMRDLDKLAPDFDWAAYYRELQLSAVRNPQRGVARNSIKQVNTLLSAEPLEQLENVFPLSRGRHVLRRISRRNSCEENFNFYREYLRGAKEQQPRWKRCVQYTDYNLGEALGQAYVAKVFSPELKASTLDMVDRIEAAMGERIRALDWMSPETKQQALVKLAGIRNKIGYPDKWRDYSSVKIVPQ